jgi:uncharacterized protein YcbK (DUF882 family)
MPSSKWKYFTEEEMCCSHCGECHMDEEFMELLDDLRGKVGKPIIVSSGYRCPEYNDQVSSTGLDGPHATGKAVDIAVSGRDAHRVLFFAMKLGFSGVGVSQTGDHDSRFIHLDTLTPEESDTRPWVWSY